MKVTVIIPCYNEAKSIAKVINGFPKARLTKLGYKLDILVVDNCSADDTAKRARKAGARVVTEKTKGKGHAIKTGFANLQPDTDFVVMIDGDNTYRSNEILRMLEPLESNFCDAVMGSRLAGKMYKDSMTGFNRGGNWLYTYLVRIFFPGVNVTDVLTGYFAWKREMVDNLLPNLRSGGFAVEMEMITKMARMGLQVYSVPISYHPRIGHTHLRPIHDGFHILKMFGKSLVWRPAPGVKIKEDHA